MVAELILLHVCEVRHPRRKSTNSTLFPKYKCGEVGWPTGPGFPETSPTSTLKISYPRKPLGLGRPKTVDHLQRDVAIAGDPEPCGQRAWDFLRKSASSTHPTGRDSRARLCLCHVAVCPPAPRMHLNRHTQATAHSGTKGEAGTHEVSWLSFALHALRNKNSVGSFP